MRRALMGLAMAVTAVSIIYSPWGRRSGAHLNPAVTLTFWRLGKVAGWDAAFYNVFGPRLRITTLRAASGPGVELLEYLTPRTGRRAPVDTGANDLIHWHTTVVAPDPTASAARLRGGRADFLSAAVVRLPDRVLGFGAGFLARDPDGHALRVIGPEGAR